MLPPPISTHKASSSGGKRLLAAMPPRLASSSPLITFIAMPSSFFNLVKNTALFGASRRAEVPPAMILRTL